MQHEVSDWQPTATLRNLQIRSEVVWKLRSLFREHGFLEVHTPLLSSETVLDRHIEPIAVAGRSVGVSLHLEDTFYLQTSPEFAMKRLLAAGAGSIYQISSVFRNGERGEYHNPEFTMVEWYRLGDGLELAVEFLMDLVRVVLPESKPISLTYQHAFENLVGICPLTCTVDGLSQAAHRHGLQLGADWGDDRDDWLDLLFSEVIQPQLGFQQPAIVTHYPASQAALACLSSQDPRVAERFELFINGVELANGYHELLSPSQLEERNARTLLKRRQDGKNDLVPKGRLLAAMQAGIPASSGCALGLDRLLMVLTGAKRIDDVICFPIERA